MTRLDPYHVYREHDPHPSAPGAIPFELTPQERDRAKLATLELERKRREANRRDAARRTP